MDAFRELKPGERLRQLVVDGGLELPMPGSGSTASRHHRLMRLAADDLALARLAEAHTDAIAILHEAGRDVHRPSVYGVWASEGPTTDLRLEPDGAGGSMLTGTKAFCTGGGIVDRALVTVPGPHDDAPLLLDVAVEPCHTIRFDGTGWITTAFAETNTATATFDAHRVDAEATIGPPRWYLDRVGFWHGACGPAACWAGGACGLAEWAISSNATSTPDPHRDAHCGAMATLAWSMEAVLERAGDEIDGSPGDRDGAMRRALMVRHVVERAATEILDRIGRSMGPRPFAFDRFTSRRLAEVQLYIRQCHAERDLEGLGRALRAAANAMDEDRAGGR